MTRKRFIKLCMGYEIQRNEAETITNAVAEYGSYRQLWAKHSFALEWRYNTRMTMRDLIIRYKGRIIGLDLSGYKDMSCAIE